MRFAPDSSAIDVAIHHERRDELSLGPIMTSLYQTNDSGTLASGPAKSTQMNLSERSSGRLFTWLLLAKNILLRYQSLYNNQLPRIDSPFYTTWNIYIMITWNI